MSGPRRARAGDRSAGPQRRRAARSIRRGLGASPAEGPAAAQSGRRELGIGWGCTRAREGKEWGRVCGEREADGYGAEWSGRFELTCDIKALHLQCFAVFRRAVDDQGDNITPPLGFEFGRDFSINSGVEDISDSFLAVCWT